jgi:transposase
MDEAAKTQLKILKLSGIKPNFTKLAKMYDMDRRTVKKYYDGYEGKPKHHAKASKLDEHKDLIRHKLEIKGSNIMAVYQFLYDKYGQSIGTYSNFRKYLKTNGMSPAKAEKGHPRFETEPGIQAQVDWKEDISIANRYGEIFTFQVFDYKLGYSRYPIFIYKLYKTRQDVFDCLITAFKTTGGVPREILFDNMSSVVDRDGNRKNISSKVRAFAHDFNFKIKLCKPRHPFTKGKVEAMNKFLAWLMPYQGEFETEDELIEILNGLNQKVCNRPCDETGVPPLLLFQKEKEYLQPLPSVDVIESYLTHDRQTTVRKDSMITYNKCKYSVPAEYIGKPVRLRVFECKLYIYYSTEIIATHAISNKRLNYNELHYKQLLGSYMKDPEAIDVLAERNLQQLDNLL